MIKIALCDDKLEEITYTAKLLESAIINNSLDAEIVLISSDQDDIYDKIKSNEIDVLFLDIEFGNVGKNGIEFAKLLRSVNNIFCLIFMTGQFEYSLLAYQCKTFAYLLKPVLEDKVNEIICRLKEEYTVRENNKFIKINKDYSIRMDEILYIERNKGKTTVVTSKDTFFTNDSLNLLIKKLPTCFKRIHRSYIINTSRVIKTSKENNLIYFENNISCPLGSTRFAR